MAQIFELLGPIPTTMSLSGRSSHLLFTSAGELRAIKNLKHWPLVDVYFFTLTSNLFRYYKKNTNFQENMQRLFLISFFQC